MKVFARVDPVTHAATGFWNDEAFALADIPTDTVEITEQDWVTYCGDQGRYSFTADGALLDTPSLPPAMTREGLGIMQKMLLAEVRDRIDEAVDRDEPTADLIAYRKALRLLLDNVTDPTTVVWPTRPW